MFSLRDYRKGDFEKVIKLHRICFGEKNAVKLKKLFNWLYFENPYCSKGINNLVVEYEGEIIGFLGLIPWKIKLINSGTGIKSKIATFGSSLMTHPEHREKGVSISLLKRWKEKTGICLGLGVHPVAKQREMSVGFKEIDLVRHHVKIMHPLVRSGDQDVKEIKDIEEIRSKMDIFCRKAMADYGILTYRDSTYLGWRYFRHPQKRYKFYAALKGSEVKGYIVLDISEGTFRWGRIIDLFTSKDDDETKRKLLRKSFEHFKREKCTFVRIMTSSDEYARVLKKGWFFSMDLHPKNFVIHSKEPITLDRKKWFINHGDSDIGM